MLLIIILSMWNMSKIFTTSKGEHFCVKILSDNSPLGPQFSKYWKLKNAKLSFSVWGLSLYTTEINFNNKWIVI